MATSGRRLALTGSDARLEFPPALPRGPRLPAGTSALGLEKRRDTLVRAPAGDDRPAPLIVLLHGAGGDPAHALDLLQHLPEAAGAVLLAPQSRRTTWDVIAGGWGPDVELIQRALHAVTARRAIDPTRLVIGGFSDGASYALCLGLANGDVFSSVLAFSPGFAAPLRQEGRPRVFISHGTEDQVLPIEPCSRRIVRQLRIAGYELRYREFPGGHTVPPALAAEAVSWGFGRAAAASSR